MIHDEEHFLHVQSDVLDHTFQNESAGADPIRFIIEHAPLFRHFATHLPKDLEKSWGNAKKSGEAQKKIEERYGEFAREIENSIEVMDPDARTALTEAAERGDILGASRILEAHLPTQNELA